MKEQIRQIQEAFPSQPGDKIALMIQPDLVIGGKPDSNNITEPIYLTASQEKAYLALEHQRRTNEAPKSGH
jgi:hypothetical protein